MRMGTSLRRVLVTAPASDHQRLQDLFREHALANWETVFSTELDEAKFFMQHCSVDVWLIHEDATSSGAGHALKAVEHADVPAFFLCEPSADSILPAFQADMISWLPSSLVWDHPGLLASGIRNAVRIKRQQRRSEIIQRKWQRCRRRVDRLVQLIWRTTPVSSPQEWLPQRFALERLQEEVARTNRFGEPLSVAIGQIRADGSHANAEMTEWMPKVIGGVKRRCDVIGQYGMNGFLLVMVHTPKNGAVTCCKRLQDVLEHKSESHETQVDDDQCRAFFGVAEASEGVTPQQLLRHAEENLDVAVQGKAGSINAI